MSHRIPVEESKDKTDRLNGEKVNLFQRPNVQYARGHYKRQIDQMVYKLYGLTPAEIKIVESCNEKH